jgi:hypothetical protein
VRSRHAPHPLPGPARLRRLARAGLITLSPPHLLHAPEDGVIEDISRAFKVVKWVTVRGDKNAVIMDDCEQYYLARVGD